MGNGKRRADDRRGMRIDLITLHTFTYITLYHTLYQGIHYGYTYYMIYTTVTLYHTLRLNYLDIHYIRT